MTTYLALGRHRRRGGAGRAPRHLRHRPDRPETGYGYIEAGDAHRRRASMPSARFVEKPDRATRPRRCWPRAASTGTPACSCSRRQTFLAEAEALCARKAIAAARGRSEQARTDLDFIRLDERASPPPPTSRSTTPSSRRRRWSSLIPVSFPGRTSAAGTRCGRSPARTPPATWSRARRRSPTPPNSLVVSRKGRMSPSTGSTTSR